MVDLFPLKLTAASTSRRGRTLVGPLDLSMDGQGITVVLGPNGSGKTSLLRLIHGTARLTTGAIEWACSTADARNRQAFVFQRPILLRRSVEENLMYPLRLRKVPKGEARAAAHLWADRVGLTDQLDRMATVLSGGEQQKLAIARALITDPTLVFLDEPTASLDGRSIREIEAVLQQASVAGTKLVMATHDMGQARRLADDAVFLIAGQLHEHRPAAEFFSDAATPEARAFINGDILE